MPQIQRLRHDHAKALRQFEEHNRVYFAQSVPDRGDDYFTHFDNRHAALLAEQDTGECHFHLIIDDDQSTVLGRINLVDVAEASADLGFRVAQSATGKGLATWAVRQLCTLSTTEYQLATLRAAATHDNPGSQGVLRRTGFAQVGDITLGGRPGIRFIKQLVHPRGRGHQR